MKKIFKNQEFSLYLIVNSYFVKVYVNKNELLLKESISTGAKTQSSFCSKSHVNKLNM